MLGGNRADDVRQRNIRQRQRSGGSAFDGMLGDGRPDVFKRATARAPVRKERPLMRCLPRNPALQRAGAAPVPVVPRLYTTKSAPPRRP